MPKPLIIAIDGPVAAGKSTIGGLLAQRLGYRFLDTGEMYRALTWKALKLNIDLEDEAELSQLASSTKIELVTLGGGDERYCVLVDGRDVVAEIHAPEVEAGVSLVARVAGVRTVMVEQQRRLAQDGKIVMAGRDIGTTVLPHAELKVYLGASFAVRARRRYQEVIERGEAADYQTILAELMRRDEIDSQRPISPLEPASDARVIDTDGLNPDQVLAEILSMMDQ